VHGFRMKNKYKHVLLVILVLALVSYFLNALFENSVEGRHKNGKHSRSLRNSLILKNQNKLY